MRARGAHAWMIALAAGASLGACRQRPADAAQPAAPAPAAGPAHESPPAEEDPAWIAGTWKKEGALAWLLCNPPEEAVELAGIPARIVRRGKLVVHGQYVSVVFAGGELHLKASGDRARLLGEGQPPLEYQRGAPP